jgi:hypothetical protein
MTTMTEIEEARTFVAAVEKMPPEALLILMDWAARRGSRASRPGLASEARPGGRASA